MDRLEAMSMLVEVVEKGSFSAAARTMRVPVTTVTRKVSDLESVLGAKLLVRTTRKLSLTDAGITYHSSRSVSSAVGLHLTKVPQLAFSVCKSAAPSGPNSRFHDRDVKNRLGPVPVGLGGEVRAVNRGRWPRLTRRAFR